VTAITELARRGVAVRVLVLTTYDTDSHVLPAIEAGATGYLLKDAPRDELLRAVRSAAQGEAVLSPSVAARLMNRFRAPGAGPLSQRELEVLGLVAAGNTNLVAGNIGLVARRSISLARSRARSGGRRLARPGSRPGSRAGVALARDRILASRRGTRHARGMRLIRMRRTRAIRAGGAIALAGQMILPRRAGSRPSLVCIPPALL